MKPVNPLVGVLVIVLAVIAAVVLSLLHVPAAGIPMAIIAVGGALLTGQNLSTALTTITTHEATIASHLDTIDKLQRAIKSDADTLPSLPHLPEDSQT